VEPSRPSFFPEFSVLQCEFLTSIERVYISFRGNKLNESYRSPAILRAADFSPKAVFGGEINRELPPSPPTPVLDKTPPADILVS
jgi:hypothetical protein